MKLNRLLTVITVSLLMALSIMAQGNQGKSQKAPDWARGTWYWMNGADRTMTIDKNGRITLNTAGMTSNGVYYKGKIYLDGNSSTITQVGNNIRTYNETTGETSDYSHNVWNGGNNPGTGNMERPPDWARGTWYWTNGPDRKMVIDNDGRITLMTAGRTTYGTYWRGMIYLDGNTSTVSKSGKNIRTFNQNTNETSDYSKNIWRSQR